MLLCISAANRDSRQWPDADQYRVERRARNTLVFGGGVHNCLGQRTARLEAECLLTELIRHIGSIELAGEPTWQAINALRTLDRLPLKITLN
jgi:cytochrome P450